MNPILKFILFILPPYSLFSSKAKDISQEEFISRQPLDNDYFILDVRTKKEFLNGHIEKAINISHIEITSRLSEIPKDKDLIIYCHSGRRAKITASLLSKNDYIRLFHLDGDMILWRRNNKPLSTG